jgi:WD40 repeat protein
MKGHTKKAHVVRFHPTVQDVLCSASYDQTVRLWDINTQQEKIRLGESSESAFGDVVQSLDWNWPANALLTSCRDGEARLFDPRTQTLILVTNLFQI